MRTTVASSGVLKLLTAVIALTMTATLVQCTQDDKPENNTVSDEEDDDTSMDVDSGMDEPVDEDGDGYSGDADPDDTDPCVPDEFVDACELEDDSDAGVRVDSIPVEYMGEYEEGVKCGDRLETCELDQTCCVYADWYEPEPGQTEFIISGECENFSCNTFAHNFTADVKCDGELDCVQSLCADNPDCEYTPVCCANLPGIFGTETQCRADNCRDSEYEICIDNNECGDGELCCSVKLDLPGVTATPLDIGACFPTDDCARVRIGRQGVNYIELDDPNGQSEEPDDSEETNGDTENEADGSEGEMESPGQE